MNELKQQIIDDLTKLPLILNEKAVELLSLKNQMEELKFNSKLEEQKKMELIERLTGEDGKPKYSNMTKRQKAVEEMLAGDQNYQANLTNMNNIKVEIDNLSLQLQFVQNKFSAAKAMSRLVGSD